MHKANVLKRYPDSARMAAFPLGGIGTGNISIGARGELRDWEIFNNPAKGNGVPYAHFALWAKTPDSPPIARVLESRLQPPYEQARGLTSWRLGGLPRLASSEMCGEYPFVQVDFKDDTLPVSVSLEAFTPFIPLNADDSGIPAAVIRYRVKNTSGQRADVTVAGTVPNLSGFTGYNLFENVRFEGEQQNEFRTDDGLQGLFLSGRTLAPTARSYGNLALMTSDTNVTVKTEWQKTGWWDGAQDYWDDFSEDGRLERETRYGRDFKPDPKIMSVGTLGIVHTLAPGEEKVFEFILAWYFPNRCKGWEFDMERPDGATERNYYATLFDNAWDAGRYLLKNLDRLEKASRDFHRALFSGTCPDYVLEALANNITALRSNTCFRIESGLFAAWEGCHDTGGSCSGTCTHVWNYAQTAAFLFPELEQSARANELNLETDGQGSMAFRTHQIFGLPKSDLPPAADGQMGVILRTYREWKLSGDDGFLRGVWDGLCRAIDFAISHWDKDGDGLPDYSQHNTYDIEFYGPNPLTGAFLCAALKAGAEMSEHMGDTKRAARYHELFIKAGTKMDELLWNGEYYVQRLDDINRYKYQFGDGCLSDQLLAQTLAHVVGLGYVLPEQHVKKAVKSVFDNNFKKNLSGVGHIQRTYALNDESGLLLCSWPKGGRPNLPFVYSDEVWTGVEYHVAAHLIYEGFVDEGLTLVKAVRDRHDGFRRNPWNEVECGHHYARSMASWAVLTALSGFRADGETMTFAPAVNADNFSTFWSTGNAWGIYTQRREADGSMTCNTEVLYEKLTT